MLTTTAKRKKPANLIRMVAVSANHINDLEQEIKQLKKIVDNAEAGLFELRRYAESPKFRVTASIPKDDVIEKVNEILSWMARSKY